jgi:cell division FtsZ-interacting protein ZapD
MLLPVNAVNLAGYSPTDLLALRDRIHEHLPHASLHDLDLGQELVFQYVAVKDLIKDMDTDAPLNQQAQAFNTLTTVIKTLQEAQRAHFTVARQQALERTLFAVLRKYPELQTEFMSALEEALSL